MKREVGVPGIGKITVDKTVNCLGQVCPVPQLMTKRAIREMKEGEVLEVLISNPPSLETVPAILPSINAIHLGTLKDGNIWRLFIKKGK